jgi:hypothetical protein
MVGLLYALDGTPLHERLRASGRLFEEPEPVNGHFGYTNIRTLMPQRTLLEGYRRVVDTIYDPDRYFDRAFKSIVRLRRPATFRDRTREVLGTIRRLVRSMPRRLRGEGGRIAATARLWTLLGNAPPEFRRAARRFMGRVLRTRPDQLYMATKLLIFGYHVYMFTIERVLPGVDAQLRASAEPLLQAPPVRGESAAPSASSASMGS